MFPWCTLLHSFRFLQRKLVFIGSNLNTDMSNVWQQYDMQIAAQPMPAEFRRYHQKSCPLCLNSLILNRHYVHILCNDCEEKTTTRLHFLGNKCKECGGYNTSILSTEVRSAEEEEEEANSEQATVNSEEVEQDVDDDYLDTDLDGDEDDSENQVDGDDCDD
jgi:Zn finger protein HypA/HybF involved in hydrogenase expression